MSTLAQLNFEYECKEKVATIPPINILLFFVTSTYLGRAALLHKVVKDTTISSLYCIV